jgi:hypothetical protein
MAKKSAHLGRRSYPSSIGCPRQLVRERVLRNHGQRIIADLNIGRANGSCFCLCDQVVQTVVTRTRCARIDHWRSEACETKAQTTPRGRHAGEFSLHTDRPFAVTAIPWDAMPNAGRIKTHGCNLQLALGRGWENDWVEPLNGQSASSSSPQTAGRLCLRRLPSQSPRQ